MHMRFYYSMQLLIVQLLLSVLETKAKAEMADESVTESTEIEKPRSRGRPTKHATPHLTEDNELKVTVEGLSTLKRTPTTSYIIRFKSHLLCCCTPSPFTHLEKASIIHK